MSRIIAITIFLTLFLSPIYMYGQQNSDSTSTKRHKFTERLVFGANIGASFGRSTFIEVSPLIGYKITNRLVSGLQFSYNYFSNSFSEGSIYGPSVFARYNVSSNIFIHTEYQQSYIRSRFIGSAAEYNDDFRMMLVGGGYFVNLGRTKIGATILYDLIEDPKRIYRIPIFRTGFMFSL